MSESAGHVEATNAAAGLFAVVVASYWTFAVLGMALAAGSRLPATPGEVALLGVLAVAGYVTELFAVRINDSHIVSAGAVTLVLAAVLLGPLAAGAVGFVQLLVDVREPPLARWLVHAPLRVLVGLGGAVAVLALPRAGLAGQTLAAAGAVLVVDLAGNALIVGARGKDVRAFVVNAARCNDLPFLLYLPIIWLTAIAYERAGTPAMALVFGPTLLAQYIFRLYQERAKAHDTLTEANLSFAISLIRALDAADSYTAGHSAAVGVYARDVALELGYEPAGAAVIQLSALLHDVGKIGVPTDILRKPSRLDDREWREIQRHPATGQEITGEVPVFRYVAEAIRHHHERPDGTGYPDGLRAGEIPRAALIIGVVDAYSAMTQPRVYREARPPEAAADELRRCAGTQFDAEMVAAFLHVLEREPYGYRAGHDDVFAIDRQRADILRRLGRAGSLREAIAAA